MVSREQVFALNVVWGVLSILLSAVALYFVQRYAVVVLSADDRTRRLLLGDWVADLVGDTATSVLVAVSLYIGFKVVYLIVSVAALESLVADGLEDLRARRAG